MTPKEIAQWVIENRYTKEGQRMTDTEMFNLLCDKLNEFGAECFEAGSEFKPNSEFFLHNSYAAYQNSQ